MTRLASVPVLLVGCLALLQPGCPAPEGSSGTASPPDQPGPTASGDSSSDASGTTDPTSGDAADPDGETPPGSDDDDDDAPVDPPPPAADPFVMTFYGMPGCPFCSKVERSLQRLGEKYAERVVFEVEDAMTDTGKEAVAAHGLGVKGLTGQRHREGPVLITIKGHEIERVAIEEKIRELEKLED